MLTENADDRLNEPAAIILVHHHYICTTWALWDSLCIGLLQLKQAWPTRVLCGAADLIGRISNLACPSVRPSVCPLRAHNLKTKRHRKNQTMWTSSRAGVTAVCQFAAKKVKRVRWTAAQYLYVDTRPPASSFTAWQSASQWVSATWLNMA